jgi:hypothetical protein
VSPEPPGDKDAQSQCCMLNLGHRECDDWEGRSLSPKGVGPKAFGSNVCGARLPKHFWASSNILKYDGKTKPSVWLEDYYLAGKVSGVDDGLFIIQFLPIYLVDLAMAWLDQLPRYLIDSWEDLKEIFTRHFQGTYVQPANPWDQKCCRQKSSESLRDYIRHFSQKCHELSRVADADIFSAFWSSTTCHTLMHELGCDQPRSCLISPLGMPLARRLLGLRLFWAVGR